MPGLNVDRILLLPSFLINCGRTPCSGCGCLATHVLCPCFSEHDREESIVSVTVPFFGDHHPCPVHRPDSPSTRSCLCRCTVPPPVGGHPVGVERKTLLGPLRLIMRRLFSSPSVVRSGGVVVYLPLRVGRKILVRPRLACAWPVSRHPTRRPPCGSSRAGNT